VDGLHTEEQVYKDILNSLDFLAPGGRIVAHDCNPKTAEWENTGRNGTVWRGWLRLRSTRPDLSMCVVDTDYGCGVIRRGGQVLYPEIENPTFNHLSSDRISLLNLVSVAEFLRAEQILSDQGCRRNSSSGRLSYNS
jgi:hypothetical protein